MKAITARKAAAHITPLMDAMWHRGIVTAEDCIFDSFEKFAADIASNNEVRIRSGVGMLQGRFFCIEPGTYDSAAISNGTQGEKRIDLIVARWTVNASSETEDVEIKVIQGTPTTDTPVAPDYTEGDLDDGELVADLPLYEVNVNGINIESLSAQFETGWLLRNGPLPVSKGGTGGTSAAGARQNINYIGIDPIMGGTANDTPANWAALGSGIAKINESGIVLNKPTTCGIIISNVVDGNVTQLWQGITSDGMWFRQGANNSWGTWKKILDEDSLSLDKIYPIGAVYISYNSTSPAELFGGTWTEIKKVFPYFNSGTDTGGSNTHTLTTAQMPSHKHSISVRSTSGSSTGWRIDYQNVYGQTVDTDATGGGGSHNNMPAYQTFYAWRRVS